MGKSSAPKADPQLGAAALAQADIGREWLQFAREQFGVANQRQVGIDEIAKTVTQSQVAAQDQAARWATEDRDRAKSIFRPLQDQFVQKAQTWDGADRQQMLAAEARADVIRNSESARQTRARQMAGMGILPGSGRYAGVEAASDMQTALAAAGAQNGARAQARKEALALQGEAINMGNGLPGQAASALGLGVGAGQAAVGATVSANTANNQANNIMGQGFSGALQGYQGQINGLNTQFQQQMQSYNAQNAQTASLMGGIGSLAGLMLSDEDEKEDKRPVRGVLEAVKKMPVEAWKYKDGAGDEGEHIGTYAQDFKRQTGLGDGKSINVVDAIGVTMGAVKELAEKVDKLAAGPRAPRTIKPKRILKEAA